MAPADDIRSRLPQPPPPHSERRSATIGTALARYDETQRGIRSKAGASEGVGGRWLRLFALQYAALATIAVVVLVSLPQLDTTNRTADVATQEVASGTATRDGSEGASVTTETAPALPAMVDTEMAAASALEPPLPRIEAPPPAADPPDAAAPAAPSISRQVEDRAVMAAAPAPPPPPAPAVMAAEAAPEPSRGFADSAAAADADGQIVVTAQRRRASAAPAANAWSACTLDDPKQALARCRRQIDPAAKGPQGRAAASLADGLSLGWSGDLDGAVRKFDEAIDLTPRSTLAYLNRGLAKQRRGDVAGAAADFDAAVRYGRADARAYYFRGRFKREQGDVRSASEDEQRARDIDLADQPA